MFAPAAGHTHLIEKLLHEKYTAVNKFLGGLKMTLTLSLFRGYFHRCPVKVQLLQGYFYNGAVFRRNQHLPAAGNIVQGYAAWLI